MTRLSWDKLDERFYEYGVDQGVLYLSDGSGVPWSGLVSVQESTDGDSSEPLYIDGVKYMDTQNIGDYLATLQAFTYPDEFLEYEGQYDILNGLTVGEQAPKSFGLSYRTKVGNPLDGDFGYQIHVLYNLTAMPAAKDYVAPTNVLAPLLFNWQIAGVPEEIDDHRPTAHVIFDSRYLGEYQLSLVEDFLYGCDSNEASLPPLNELADLIVNFVKIKIIDNGDGSWTAIGPSQLIKMLNPTTFQITGADAVYLDEDTYRISTTP